MGRTNLRRVFRIKLILVSIGAALAAGAGCQKSDGLLDPSQTDPNTILLAVYRGPEELERNPITLDGQAIEREWGGESQPFLNVRISTEQGVGPIEPPAYVSMKAIYTDQAIYFLVRWVDPNPDESKDAMVYVGTSLDSLPEGCRPELMQERNWIRNPRGIYDEDRLALAFESDSAGNDIGPFSRFGCLAACHAHEQPSFGRLAYGRLDIWQWLAARTNPVRDLFDRRESAGNPLHGIPGYLDDLFADAIGGLQADPGTPSYRPNFEVGSDIPLYVYRLRDDPFANPNNPAACFNEFGENPCRKNNGVNLRYIWREEVELNVPRFGECDTTNLNPLPIGTEPHKWQYGDIVSGWLLTYPRGDRADVHGKANYDLGIWTLEIARALNTGNPGYDVIFNPESGRSYNFTIAVMNNDVEVHKGSEPQVLVFDPKGVR